MRLHLRKTLLNAVAFAVLGTSSVWAQTGAIVGRVTSSDAAGAVAAGLAQAQTADGRTAASSVTDSDGRYRLIGLSPGTYSVVISAVGYAELRMPGVTVTAGATTVADAVLNAQAFDLSPVVVSASRQTEKAVDAPAHVEVIGEREIDMRPTLTPADHLRGTVGVDIVTQGVQSTNVVVRGFNNIFSGALHMLTDNRIAGVPSLRLNAMHFIPSTNADLERMEVVLGPGAALYGPNTADGVVHMITKSPLAEPGTTVSIAGGEQSFMEASGRSAVRISDRLGLKVSALYMQAEEFEFLDPTEAAEAAKFAGPLGPAFKADLMRSAGIGSAEADRRIALIGNRDLDIERWSFETRADWRATDELNTIFSYGTTNIGNAVELTGLGGGQAKDWRSSYAQARASWNRLFVQGYVNFSDAGDTYLLRNGAPIQDESKLYVAQLQHGFRLGNQHNFTYGADLLLTRPETNGTINGIYEDEDETDEIGGYAQWEWAMTPKFDVVLAGRVDDHSALPDPIFSPRAALVFKPAENQAFRATFNQAFSTPSSLNQFLDLGSAFPAGNTQQTTLALLGYSLRVQGTGQTGFHFQQPDGSYLMRSPFTPGAPETIVPAAAAASYFPAAVQVLAQLAAQRGQPLDPMFVQYLSSLRPTPAQVGASFFDPATGQSGAIASLSLPDIEPIRESTTTSIEGGYRGVIGNKLLLAADLWWARKENLVTPLTVATPLITLNGQGLVAFLVPRFMQDLGMSQEQATATAISLAGSATSPGLATIPVGVISSAEVNANGAQVLATYYNVDDELDYYGADLTATYLLSNVFSLGGTLSLVNDNVFETSRGENITLNAPKAKASAVGTYRNINSGLGAELRVRWNDEFPVRSGVYNATLCIGGTEPGAERCVESFTLLDVTASYEIPRFRGVALQLSVNNLLDEDYRSFPGVPNVGRMAILRARYTF